MSDGRRPVLRRPGVLDQIAAWMELIRRSEKTHILFVSHNMGGGCERHIQELGEYLREDVEILTARASNKKEVLLHFGTRREGVGLRFKMPDNYDELVKLCKYLGISRIHYHHCMTLHHKIQELPADLDIPYDITLHDYWFINADPSLTKKKGYHTQDLDLPDRICSDAGAVADTITAHKKPENHVRFLYQADRAIAPSAYTARLYKGYFPDFMPIVAYHPDREKCGSYPAVRIAPVQSGEFLRVAVLGAMSREKGADILEETALQCRDRGFRVKFYLIGYGYRPLNKEVTTLGPYKESMLKHHIEEIQPHLIWFPALRPETYSYTLSAALEAGSPVIASDMGPFVERLARRPMTWIKGSQTSAEGWAAFFNMLRETVFEDTRAAEIVWNDQPKTAWNYAQNYNTPSVHPGKASDEFRLDEKWTGRFVLENSTNSKEKVLAWLIHIRCHPVIAKLLQKVPYHIERGIKRWFSRRPIHEIIHEKKNGIRRSEMKKSQLSFVAFMCSLLFLGNSFSLAANNDWKNINGAVLYNGTPVCAMVLANGQYMFTCSGDGSFNLDVPLDGNGQITVFAFCSGLAPFEKIIYPLEGQGMQIDLADAEGGSFMDVTSTLTAINTTRVRLEGAVSYNGTPVCAMVLANGQFMFTCSEEGSYSLDVPLDDVGSITLFGFCSGLLPYKYVFTTDQISFNDDTDNDGYSISQGDCDDFDAGINPGAAEICGDGIDQDCDGADIPCHGDGRYCNASGTYTYNSGTNILVVNFTSSNFEECGTGPQKIGTEQFYVNSISYTTMIWNDDESEQMTWTRNGGTVGDIVGKWSIFDDGNTYEIDFYSNGSFFLGGYIVNFDEDVISDYTIPWGNITIDGSRADWDAIGPVFTDAVNDEDPEADFDGTDLYQFYLSRDDTFLYLMITLYDGNPNPYAQYTFEMTPNAGSCHGEVGDYLALAKVADGSWASFVRVRDAPSLNIQYPAGYVATGDHFIEWKVELSDIFFFNDRYVCVYIHNYSPIFYPVSDRKGTGIRVHLD